MIMLHTKTFLSAGMIFSAVMAAAVLTGCYSTTIIPVSVTVPGEFNLSGVSKIAMVNLNTVPSDPLTGTYAADPETRAIVQHMIASAFYKSKVYQVADLDLEKSIVAKHAHAKIANRYNAVIYGRLWWQVSPEYRMTYPEKYTLETWRDETYYAGTNPLTNQPMYLPAHVTKRMQDVLTTKYFRANNANLMLSLTLYRIDNNGQLEKTTETFAVASQNFQIDNGKFSKSFKKIGADGSSRASRLKKTTKKKTTVESWFTETGEDVSGRVVAIKNSKTIPGALQLKLMLAEKLSSDLISRLSPSQIVFNITCDFFDYGLFNLFNDIDEKLFNLMKDGAFKAAREYVNFVIRTNVGNKVASKIGPLDDAAVYPVPRYINPAKDPEEITDETVMRAAKKHIEYLYVLAVCEEAMGEYDRALESYRYIFNLNPKEDYALGISRCLFALGMNDRVKEKTKAKNTATKKSSVK